MKGKHRPYGPYEQFFKWPVDIFCALAAILVFSWLYLIVAVLVRVKLGSPVLFALACPAMLPRYTAGTGCSGRKNLNWM